MFSKFTGLKKYKETESVLIYYDCKMYVTFFFFFSVSLSTIYCERFSFKITNKSCNKELKYCKFTRKINKAKHVMKKDHSKR